MRYVKPENSDGERPVIIRRPTVVYYPVKLFGREVVSFPSRAGRRLLLLNREIPLSEWLSDLAIRTANIIEARKNKKH